MFTVIVITSCVILCCFVMKKSYELTTKAGSRIYVLTNGKVLEAFAADRKDNIPVEAKDHIKSFHQYFFSLDPDDCMYRLNYVPGFRLKSVPVGRQQM